MINGLRVAAGGDIERHFRQCRFETHDGVGLFGRISGGDAGQLQHPGDMGDIFFAGFDGFGVGAEVVVFFGQAEPALVGLSDYGVRILGILAGGEIEEHVDAYVVQPGDFLGEVAGVFDGVNPIEFGLDGLKPFLIDGGFIHAGKIVVADFLRIGIPRGGGGGLLENLAEDRLVTLVEFAETAP